MATFELSDDEIRKLANQVAGIIMPQIAEIIKGKATWTVKELSKLSADYMSIKDLAKLFKVTDQHIRNLIGQGLPVVKVGTHIRIDKSLVRHAIDEGRLLL